VIKKKAWSFYKIISGVRLCWELEESKGPKGGYAAETPAPSFPREIYVDESTRKWKFKLPGHEAGSHNPLDYRVDPDK
jgi:hypothetical protein